MATEGQILSAVTMEDLQEQHREIAECIGLPAFKELIRTFGGQSIYIPQAREAARLHTYRMIRQEYDGTNIKGLSRKYGVSESTVYNVVRDQLRTGQKKIPDIPGQMTIADILGEP